MNVVPDIIWSPTNSSPSLFAVVIFFGLTLLFVFTLNRVLTSQVYHSNFASHIPHWIPYVGHLFEIYRRPDNIIRFGSRNAQAGLFSIYVLGRRHYVLTSVRLTEIANEQQPWLQSNGTRYDILSRISGLSNAQDPDIRIHLDSFFHEIASKQAKLTPKLIQVLEENLPNLVSGCRSAIDHTPWEKDAGARLLTKNAASVGENTCCSFLKLIWSFTNHIILRSLSDNTPEHYLMSLSKCLIDLNANSFSLALGLPRWPAFFLPMPSIHASFRARNEALRVSRGFAKEGSQLISTEWVSGAEHSSTSSDIAPEIQLAILWDMTKDAGPSIFWTLLHLFSAPDEILSHALREASDIISIKESPPIIPGSDIREPPQVNVDIESLGDIQKCPIIFAYFLECVRVYSLNWSSQVAGKDFDLNTDSGSRVQILSEDYVDVVWELCNRDKSIFDTADSYLPSRYLTFTPDKRKCRLVADHLFIRRFQNDLTFAYLNTVTPYLLASIASILSMWRVTPIGLRQNAHGRLLPQGSWTEFPTPRTKRTASIALPKEDIQVQISRRLPA